jgi:hypothetical protein
MKRMTSVIVKSLFAILISGGPLALAAHAQDDSAITANVPFAFSVGNQEIAAGTYKLRLTSDPFQMSVRNVHTGYERIFAVRPEVERKFTSQGRLMFQVCDGRIYLAEIHISGTNRFSETVNGGGQGGAQRGADAAACSKENSTVVALR